MNGVLGMLWPIVFLIGCFFLLAAHAAKSNKDRENYLEDAYKWAMLGGLLILASIILMWISRY